MESGSKKFWVGIAICWVRMYVLMRKVLPILATSHMFNFSEQFVKEYLPTTIELGRSFVTLEYQSTRAGSKGLFAFG